MPTNQSLIQNMGRPTVPKNPVVDLNVPNFDRTNDRGNYISLSLTNGEITFSSYCASFSRALAMTRLTKRSPTWVLHGSEQELVTIQRLLAMKADWLTPKMVDNLVRSQLGKTTQVVTTINL